MQTPKVIEISPLSPHRRDAAVIRTSRLAAAPKRSQFAPGADRLRSPEPSTPPQDRFLRNW